MKSFGDDTILMLSGLEPFGEEIGRKVKKEIIFQISIWK